MRREPVSKAGDMSAGTLAVTQVRQKPVSLGALDGGGIRSFQTSRVGSSVVERCNVSVGKAIAPGGEIRPSINEVSQLTKHVRRFKSCPIHRENTLTSKSDPLNG